MYEKLIIIFFGVLLVGGAVGLKYSLADDLEQAGECPEPQPVEQSMTSHGAEQWQYVVMLGYIMGRHGATKEEFEDLLLKPLLESKGLEDNIKIAENVSAWMANRNPR